MLKALPVSGRLKTWLLIVLIVAVVWACFLPTLNNGFIWDDNANYVENRNYRGLSFSHLHWMFTNIHDANYHPLAWLTLGVDFVLWGMNPAGYHFTNIVLHTINAVLFYFMVVLFLRQVTNRSHTALVGIQLGAFVGALFFAVHPLRVEPVAWISTRADLLCGVFYILTMIAYLKQRDNQGANVRAKWFFLCLLFFVCSLLSRAWGITMPLVLLVLDVYPLRRIDVNHRSISSYKKVLAEKIPFILFALAAGLLAIWAKRGSMPMMAEHGIIDRFMQAAYGLCFYIHKTVVPTGLSPFYLLSKTFDPLAPKYIICAVLVFSVTICLVVLRHRMPWALAVWFCYAVIVSPLLGFAQSGPQIAADRYTYISCMPFGVLAGAGTYRLWIECWKQRKLFSVMAFIWIGLLFLSVMSFRQTNVWHDNRTFLDHVLELDSGNYIAYFSRGQLREKQGDWAGAIADYTNVICLDSECARAYNNRGVLRNAKGNMEGAMEDFNTAIRLAPLSPEAYANRGMIRWSQNDLPKAVQDLTRVLEVASTDWPHRIKVEQSLNDLRKQLAKTDGLSGAPNESKPANK